MYPAARKLAMVVIVALLLAGTGQALITFNDGGGGTSDGGDTCTDECSFSGSQCDVYTDAVVTCRDTDDDGCTEEKTDACGANAHCKETTMGGGTVALCQSSTGTTDSTDTTEDSSSSYDLLSVSIDAVSPINGRINLKHTCSDVNIQNTIRVEFRTDAGWTHVGQVSKDRFRSCSEDGTWSYNQQDSLNGRPLQINRWALGMGPHESKTFDARVTVTANGETFQKQTTVTVPGFDASKQCIDVPADHTFNTDGYPGTYKHPCTYQCIPRGEYNYWGPDKYQDWFNSWQKCTASNSQFRSVTPPGWGLNMALPPWEDPKDATFQMDAVQVAGCTYEAKEDQPGIATLLVKNTNNIEVQVRPTLHSQVRNADFGGFTKTIKPGEEAWFGIGVDAETSSNWVEGETPNMGIVAGPTTPVQNIEGGTGKQVLCDIPLPKEPSEDLRIAGSSWFEDGSGETGDRQDSNGTERDGADEKQDTEDTVSEPKTFFNFTLTRDGNVEAVDGNPSQVEWGSNLTVRLDLNGRTVGGVSPITFIRYINGELEAAHQASHDGAVKQQYAGTVVWHVNTEAFFRRCTWDYGTGGEICGDLEGPDREDAFGEYDFDFSISGDDLYARSNDVRFELVEEVDEEEAEELPTGTVRLQRSEYPVGVTISALYSVDDNGTYQVRWFNTRQRVASTIITKEDSNTGAVRYQPDQTGNLTVKLVAPGTAWNPLDNDKVLSTANTAIVPKGAGDISARNNISVSPPTVNRPSNITITTQVSRQIDTDSITLTVNAPDGTTYRELDYAEQQQVHIREDAPTGEWNVTLTTTSKTLLLLTDTDLVDFTRFSIVSDLADWQRICQDVFNIDSVGTAGGNIDCVYALGHQCIRGADAEKYHKNIGDKQCDAVMQPVCERYGFAWDEESNRCRR